MKSVQIKLSRQSKDAIDALNQLSSMASMFAQRGSDAVNGLVGHLEEQTAAREAAERRVAELEATLQRRDASAVNLASNGAQTGKLEADS